MIFYMLQSKNFNFMFSLNTDQKDIIYHSKLRVCLIENKFFCYKFECDNPSATWDVYFTIMFPIIQKVFVNYKSLDLIFSSHSFLVTGLADPYALQQAVATYQACHFIGMPECEVCT